MPNNTTASPVLLCLVFIICDIIWKIKWEKKGYTNVKNREMSTLTVCKYFNNPWKKLFRCKELWLFCWMGRSFVWMQKDLVELEPWFQPGFLFQAWQCTLGHISLRVSVWKSPGKWKAQQGLDPTAQPPHCFTPVLDLDLQEIETFNEQKSAQGTETES